MIKAMLSPCAAFIYKLFEKRSKLVNLILFNYKSTYAFQASFGVDKIRNVIY